MGDVFTVRMRANSLPAAARTALVTTLIVGSPSALLHAPAHAMGVMPAEIRAAVPSAKYSVEQATANLGAARIALADGSSGRAVC